MYKSPSDGIYSTDGVVTICSNEDDAKDSMTIMWCDLQKAKIQTKKFRKKDGVGNENG